MKRKLRFLVSTLFITVMLMTFFAVSASAAATGTKEDPWLVGSKTASNIKAYLDGDTMVISGKGSMKNWDKNRDVPWYSRFAEIRKVKIEPGVKTVGHCSFFQCRNLVEVDFGTLETVGALSFGETGLTSVNLPDTVTSIMSGAFRDTPLTGITLPAGLKVLGSSAFTGTAITEVTIPGGVADIDYMSFQNCKSLKTVTLENGVSRIGDRAFNGCTSFETLYLPTTVTYVDSGAFNNVPLKNIYFDGSREEFNTIGVNAYYHPMYSDESYVNDSFVSAHLHTLIRTRDDLLYFLSSINGGRTYEKCSVTLMNDIDLGGADLKNILGDKGYDKAFMGTFKGEGHTISNFTLTSSQHRVGLFRTVRSGARIENLYLDGVNMTLTGDKFDAGALIGLVNGSVTIENVHVLSGEIKGSNYVGGLIGEISGGSCKIINCSNAASVTSDIKHAGGIVGHAGSDGVQTFTGCENMGAVTSGKEYAGGIIGFLGNDSKDQAHTIESCINSGTVTANNGTAGGIVGGLCTDSTKHVVKDNQNVGVIYANGEKYGDAGGIIGFLEGGGSVTGNINSAEVTSVLCDAGGIVGWIEDDSTTFEKCENAGAVTGGDRAGGIVGYCGDNDHDKADIFDWCLNSGAITAGTDGGGIAGAVGTDSLKHSISCSESIADVSAGRYAGGIVGWMEGGGTFTSLYSEGNIMTTGANAGGIIGWIEDDTTTFTGCVTKGTVTGSERAGGIVGFAGDNDNDNPHYFRNCESYCDITSGKDAGGIVAGITSDSHGHEVTLCLFDGNLTGTASVGGIVGWMEGGGKFEENTVRGTVTSARYAGGIVGQIEDDPVTFTNCVFEGELSEAEKRGTVCAWDGKQKKVIGEITASIFGKGSTWIITGCTAVLAAGIVSAVIVRKKKAAKDKVTVE